MKKKRSDTHERNKKEKLLDHPNIRKILQGTQDPNAKTARINKEDLERLGNLISWIDKNKSAVHNAVFLEMKGLMINLKFYSECMTSDLGKIIELMGTVQRFEDEIKKKIPKTTNKIC